MSAVPVSVPDSKSAAELNLVCGGGGSRAVLGASGMILAAHALGIRGWRTAGGISGGSIPSLMVAAGQHPSEIVRQSISVDFASLLTPRVNLLRLWWAFFVKECSWKRRSQEAVLSSEKLGQFVEKYAPAWPENYWTVAVSGNDAYLFTAGGVYLFSAATPRELFASKPAPVGLAVRASCAVPGIIEGVTLQGRHLLDGALTEYGITPVGIAKRFFAAPDGTILACDVGEDPVESSRREHIFFRVLRRIVCGPCCDPEPKPPVDGAGVILVQPALNKIESLEFTYTADQKWQAVMAGFAAAVEALAPTRYAGDLAKAGSIVEAYSEIERTAKRKNELKERTEALLREQSLY